MKVLGIVKEYIFQEGMSSTVKIERIDKVGDLIVRSNRLFLQTNIPYIFTGEPVSDSRYGTIFLANEIISTTKLNQENYINYFKSSAFDLIGEKSAMSIVETLQENIIEKILANKKSLDDVHELTFEKKELIFKTLMNYYKEDSLKEIFTNNNLKVEFYNSMEKDLADEEAIRSCLEYDFYDYAMRKKFMSFDDIDKVSCIFSKEENFISKRIYWWAFKFAKDILFSTGNTWLTLLELKKKLQAKFFEDSWESLETSISLINKEKKLFIFDSGKEDGVKKIYVKESYDDEITIARRLIEIEKTISEKKEINFEEEIKKIEKYVSKILEIPNFKYNNEQREAMLKFCNSNVSVITGGPGTGKTTVIIGIVKLYESVYKNKNFSIMAPTGRAASRIKVDELTFATTIHRFLKAKGNDLFEFNKKNPLSKNLLIIDESSMIDNHLFASLLEGVIDVKKIVLVGDKNQLPSVGYGNLYEDIIEANKFSTTELLINNRQVNNGEQNSIIDLAAAIRNNEIKNFDFKNSSNVEFIFDKNSEESLKIIKEIYNSNSPLSLEEQITNIQIIAPMYKNLLGVSNLNNQIQNMVNPKQGDEYKKMYMTFRENDKIMFTENNGTLELYNGDVGYIKKLSMIKTRLLESFVCFSGIEKKLTTKQFANITLSYACTIHKTQGSEYEKVIIVLDDENYSSWNFVNKKMLYTGITRAKKKLFIISSQKLFINACTKEMKKRNTTLTKKIITYYENM